MKLDYRYVPGLLNNKHIVLGVTGGIAAYKSVEILRLLDHLGADVQVVLTENAKHFVGTWTFEAISKKPVISDMFAEGIRTTLQHIDLANWADCVIIAPATANIIGKYSNGIADDFLSTFLMAYDGTVILAPAMNPKMFLHQSVQKNVETLKSRSNIIVGPDIGQTACGDVGCGRMSEPDVIVDFALVDMGKDGDLSNMKVLVTAGPTHEAIDPVRYITNRSSGKMGFALAAAAVERGAHVSLITGPVALKPHSCINVSKVITAEEMATQVLNSFATYDIIIMAAAVGDWRCKVYNSSKIKKNQEDTWQFTMTKNTDILELIGKQKKSNQLVCGFAAETDDLIVNASKKLFSKNLDMIFM
ncbi:bifunctional phosphopantothenoylcysteine decarboxylase/phosphopantothenate--cysteine ligase CoaBC, partial [bacterium]|nr:bifunctional phosphopantothenoylcysteine decarboxylase/phosphopantothenate--cysteine ligase CoaBC [candidate division CSSED10-310 bacterium]